jgi:excisionase family DNA binding protein
VNDRLLTVREVADLLSVSTETVLRWVRQGKLPAIRLPGGAIRIWESALERWLADRQVARQSRAPTIEEVR